MKTVRHEGPLIIGGGLAGLSAALEAAPAPVLVATPATLLEACASAWAQGGMAAALAEDDTSPPARDWSSRSAPGLSPMRPKTPSTGWTSWGRPSTARRTVTIT